MSNLISRQDLVNQMEKLIKDLFTRLEEEQQSQKNQQQDLSVEKPIFNSNDYYNQQEQNDLQSTVDFVSALIEQLKKFQQQFDRTKEMLIMVPFEKKECLLYLQQNLELHKSNMQPSLVKSLIYFNNSEIEKKKSDDIKQKLSNFIKNQQQLNKVICPIHQQQVELVNISIDQNIQERTLCKSCRSSGKNELKLSEFLSQYLMDFCDFKISSEVSRSLINNKIFDISNLVLTQNHINNLYNDFNAQFQQRIDIIDRISWSQLNIFDKLNYMAKDYVNSQKDFLNLKQNFEQKILEKVKEDFGIVQSEITKLIDDGGLTTNKISNSNPQNFECIPKQNILQQETCQVLSFNRNDTFLATARKNVIVIWTFQQGQMNLFRQLQGHQREISCLLFDNNTDTLISAGGDDDRLIILWDYQQNNWKKCTTIQNDVGIKVMVFNSNNNKLIVGCQKGIIKTFQLVSQEPSIKFEKEIQLESNSAIFGLSIYDQKILSCGNDRQLRMMSLVLNFECTIQRNCDSVGMRIQFIDHQSFVLVQKNGWLIQYKIEWATFKEVQKLSLSSNDHDYIFSPIYYNSPKALLVVKHYRTIYFLRRLKNGNFEKISSLEYQANILNVTVSNNGKYIVTWRGRDQKQLQTDDETQQYQTYELQYQQD